MLTGAIAISPILYLNYYDYNYSRLRSIIIIKNIFSSSWHFLLLVRDPLRDELASIQVLSPIKAMIPPTLLGVLPVAQWLVPQL
jgi:hypothetical protein